MVTALRRPIDTDSEEVHHKNEDKTDNTLSNLELITPVEHARWHAIKGRYRHRFDGAIHPVHGNVLSVLPKVDRVVSVEAAGVCATYDIQMDAPHNFVANGVVVHNSGKTAIGCGIIIERGKWAVVIVPTIDLLHQYKRFLSSHLAQGGSVISGPGSGFNSLDPDSMDRGSYVPVKIGQPGDGVVDPQPITVATARTMAKA
jgi:hypothetical protein